MPVTGPKTENRTLADGKEPLWTSSDRHSASRCAEKSTPGREATEATPKHAVKTNDHKCHTKTQALTSVATACQTECRSAWRPCKGRKCDKTEYGKP
jgi:hypothetical protein